MTTVRDYDIVIFGATGFTGKNTIKYVDQMTKENGRNYTWAVAGRSEIKLRGTLKEIGDKIEKDLSNTPLIIADVKDQSSLEKMARQCRIVINTCGPYQLFGEPVVKACVENGCHHVDVSGEALYIEDMQMKYNAKAAENGVYIVSTCGFDSIPADLGLSYLRSQFEGTLNSVETYLRVREIGGPRPSSWLYYATWESAVCEMGTTSQLQSLRMALYPTKLPEFTPKLSLKQTVHRSPYDNKYSVPFLGADQSVMQRTQRFLYEEENLRPIQVNTYFSIKKLWSLTKYSIMGGLFLIQSRFKCGRSLLLKYPKFYSLGYFSHEGPSEEMVQNMKCTVTLVGEGWSEKQSDPNYKFTTKPDKKMTAQVNCMNPGYGATCMSLTLCALTILDYPTKLPKKGGVYTPGATFHHTDIIKELHKNGMTFEIIYSN